MSIDDIIEHTDNFITTKPQSTNIIKVVGVGGGGNNAVQHMYKQGIQNVSFVICNTDAQALNNSIVPDKLQIGPGLGAGNVAEVGRKYAEESIDKIADIFNDNTKMVFITAGMGGGTGTGAAPVVARIAREKGLLTIGIVTIPFLFEGQKKILKALAGAEEMSKYVDALLVINNERLNEIYPDLNFMNAFGMADDTLTIAARGISELITNDNGVINIDFNDVDTTLRNGGAAVISIGYGEGENRVTKAINDALNSPLLRDRDIYGSKRILFNIYFNPDAEQPFVMKESNELTDFISNIDPNVDVIWGLGTDKSLGNKVKITLLAAGFNISGQATTPNSSETGTAKPVATPPTDVTVVEPVNQAQDEMAKLINLYGADKTGTIVRTTESQKYIIISPEQLNDDNFIELFASHPTAARDRKTIDSIKKQARATAAADDDTAQTPAASPLNDSNPAHVDDNPTPQTPQSGSTRIVF